MRNINQNNCENYGRKNRRRAHGNRFQKDSVDIDEGKNCKTVQYFSNSGINDFACRRRRVQNGLKVNSIADSQKQ